MTRRTDYQAFFVKSESGREFVQFLEKLIVSLHEKAESSPDDARDYTQQARGVREVVNHITIDLTDFKRRDE